MSAREPRILLATNGSRSARRATLVAADLAEAFSVQLVVLHVVAPVEYRIDRWRRCSLSPTDSAIQVTIRSCRT
jgi:nucleotide-binding universal stress UspA family protein